MERPAVDLPHPDSPTNPMVSLGQTDRSSPSTALTAPICLRKITPLVIGKCFFSPVTFSSGSPEKGRSSSRDPPIAELVGHDLQTLLGRHVAARQVTRLGLDQVRPLVVSHSRSGTWSW